MPALLEHHGTTLHQLKPGSIITAAAADLKLDRRKRAREADPWLPYAFHRDHVRASHHPIDLLALALKEPGLGLASGKPTTRLIYGDLDLLAAALLLAHERLAEGQAA
jgi:hypothetical protein